MNTKELKAIKIKRGIIRSSVTKLIRRTDEELDKEDKNLDILNEHKETLEGLDKSIECAINDDELEEEIEGSLEYTESIVLCKSRVSGILAQYEAAIHENENLQDIEKFNYFKSLLTDSAAIAISGLPLTPENYRKAVGILKERFGKKEILISGLTNRLLNLEQVRNTNDIFALRKLYDEMNVQIRSLESLGINSVSYGLLLRPILYKCILSNYVLQFNRVQNGKGESNVTD
ncbi:DUF1758 domain-containing protein [Caerostris extrusa]|uniref:DUF1758 domain-containing protein n=1 Tax=Caerostris extrusa TaxID=172846 RepID=A0AAV4R3P1_CAEEX|nr:DUF1758 domain-containing protein [Caerostris extrusa]